MDPLPYDLPVCQRILHYQPFAGIYSTYMVPYIQESKTTTLMMLCEAIKAVYALFIIVAAKRICVPPRIL